MLKGKLDILLVTDFFYPHWTGYAKSLYCLVQSINKFYNITILTVRHEKSLKKYEKFYTANIIREDYLFSVSRSKYSFSLILKFLQLINKYDVIFINSPCSNILPLAIITKIFGKKLYIFHQGDLILPQNIINNFIEKIFDVSSYMAFLLADKLSTYIDDYAKHSRTLNHFMYKFSSLLFPIDQLYFDRKKQSNRLINKKNEILFG